MIFSGQRAHKHWSQDGAEFLSSLSKDGHQSTTCCRLFRKAATCENSDELWLNQLRLTIIRLSVFFVFCVFVFTPQ